MPRPIQVFPSLFFPFLFLAYAFPILADECTGDYPTHTGLECWAEGGYVAPGYPFRLWDLASLTKDDFEDVFNNAICPDNATETVRNRSYNGLLMFVEDWEIGAKVLELYVGVAPVGLNSAVLSFRKHFYEQDDEKGRSGINYWPVKQEWAYPMKIYVAPSVFNPDVNSMHIDYDVAGNEPLTVKPLLDEVRQIPETNLFIGRMYFRVPAVGPVFFLWFGLELLY